MTLQIQEKKEDGLLQILNKEFEIGIDEVGRGSIFGPVFSAVVVLNKKNKSILNRLGVTDSKKLTAKKREFFFPQIISLSSDFGIGQSSVREIDQLGIRFATELSMMRAIKKLRQRPYELIVDGPLPLRSWNRVQKNIISGDSKFTSVAAASIIAKVSRDALMKRLDKKYSEYFIHKNNGYGTKEHFSSIKEIGISKLHRKSFLKKSILI